MEPFTYIDITHNLAYRIILLGMVSSFTHCLAMCGPLAAAQTTARLIAAPNLQHAVKIKASLLLPYYCGKCIAYNILLLCAYLAKIITYGIFAKHIIVYFIGALLILFGITLIDLAWTKSGLIFSHPSLQKFYQKIHIYLARKNYSTYGWQGLVKGVLLGFIPCGLVYSMLSLALLADNLFYSHMLISLFAITTIPGLFIASYLGSYVIWQKLLKPIYNLLLFINGLALIMYGLQTIGM